MQKMSSSEILFYILSDDYYYKGDANAYEVLDALEKSEGIDLEKKQKTKKCQLKEINHER